MYIKWIVCDVKEDRRDNFSIAQEKWGSIKNTNGFKGQVGGWNLKKTYEACIISFWENKESLVDFMEHTHDEIFLDNKQDETYKTISVTCLKSKFDMSGRAKDLTEALENAELLRVANCLVKSENLEHFEDVQQSVWIPKMRKSDGMLGGKFSIAEDISNRYFVATFWDSVENHQEYKEKKTPIYRQKADVSNDLISIEGKEILLVESWKILK